MSSDDKEKINVLVAYPYLKGRTLETVARNASKIRFVLDSGAFTAWKAGKEVSLDDYCKFIDSLPFEPWRYFTLDVIGDPEASMKNYETMIARGYNPVPIFTRGEDPSILDEYYKTSDVVGIGGLVGTRSNKGFVNGIMRHVGDRKVHWLGFTNLDFIKYYKPYMCDSSSFWSGALYGSLYLYKGNGSFIRLSKKDFSKKPSPDITRLLREYGFKSSSMGLNESWKGESSASNLINAKSAAMYMKDIRNHIGTKLFVACATAGQVQMLVDSYEWGDAK